MSLGLILYVIEPTIVDGQRVLTITLEDIAEELYFWGAALFGYVVGLMPNIAVIKSFIETHCEAMSRGWYINRLACKEDM